MKQKQITLAITGASGAPYALHLLKCLNAANWHVHLLVSDAARVVLATETVLNIPKAPEKIREALTLSLGINSDLLSVYAKDNWFSPVASGSSAPSKMVICPCSTGTLSAIAQGSSDNLIERAADVILKEQGKLILVPRETPLSSIHLRNMLSLSELGVTILPASPGFYHQPSRVDDLVNFVVARILDRLGIEQNLVAAWGYQPVKHKEV